MLNALPALMLLLLALIATPARAEDGAKLVRSLSLAGHGEVSVRPDMAHVNLGVVTTAVTSREALDANNKAMTAVIAALKEFGLEARDISTSNFNVGPRYDYGQNNGQAPKLTGYEVSNAVSIRVRKLEILGEVLDRVVSMGSNQVQGVSFSVSDPVKAMDEARKLAMADARRKAEVYAAAGKFAVGEVISVAESGGYQSPAPIVMKSMRAEANDAVPVEHGEQALSVDVTVVWQIK